ncbi:MAG: UDP-N-acetylmuramoyl-tripeptide--D-alanyl-D-alanine ligase [bacterium]|nr:UDP-N-acetylmuramoyl-tripeptide--D-alanyl-D-alanine ligase [bacterium]
MPELHIEEIARAVKGEILNRPAGDKEFRFTHYYFDTRCITSGGSLFFALKSENRDGHEFVKRLAGKEGVAAVVSREFVPGDITIPLIRVEDPLAAAQQLAAYVRNTYRRIKYVGITGSAGKTTTKEFVYQLLSFKYKAYRSFKNWNNWIGMPFSILNMTGDEDAAVFELAMSYPGIGEIDLLARILKPDAVVLLNAYAVHLEFLKNVDNVARAKSEILNHLDADDIAFINGDLDHLSAKTRSVNGRKVYFGRRADSNHIVLKEIVRHKQETTLLVDFFGIESRFDAPIVNRLQVENLFAAILVVQHLGMKHVEIREALKGIKPLAGRGEIKQYGCCTIVDETYNSNPEALKKTMDWVDNEYKSKKIAVVGDMLELGDNENRFHREVGEHFAQLGFDRLVTVGKRAVKIAEGAERAGFDAGKINRFDSAAEAGRFVENAAEAGSVILFKASRGIQLEKAIEEFCVNDKEK